jgi:hypothetical protein
MPLLVVIGAQKAGTTALYQYLSLHPQLVAPATKELNFFNTRQFNAGVIGKQARTFPGLQGDIQNPKVTGSFDVSPAYMLDAEQVISRIYTYAPDTTIVALLRDPIDRAYSAWNMYRMYYKKDRRWFLRQDWVRSGIHPKKRLVRRSRRFGEDFNVDISEESNVLSNGDRIEMPIVEYGLYVAQLKSAYALFPREKVLVLDSTEFRTHTLIQLRKLERLIGIERYQWTDDVLLPHFVGHYDEPMPQDAADCLREFYDEANKDLSILVRRSFSWQSDRGWRGEYSEPRNPGLTL